MSGENEETSAIERCIRSFIIKSIHAIVQARSGNAYSSACVSDVGARNNLMVYLEEDPEIGATIKQNLDSGFPIKTVRDSGSSTVILGDTFSLEILMSNGIGGLVVLEVWQFRLDTEDNLRGYEGLPCTKTITNHSGLQPAFSPKPRSPAVDDVAGGRHRSNTSGWRCFAIEDFRRTRLFERLGTLLKTIMVTTRLLPAYSFSRRQQTQAANRAELEGEALPVGGIQMCYALRRGELASDRLGGEQGVICCRQVGHLFPGLAVSPANSPSFATPIFLNISVRYRGHLDDAVLLQQCLEARQRVIFEEDLIRDPRHRKPCVRPAFATNVLSEDEDDIDEQLNEAEVDSPSGIADLAEQIEEEEENVEAYYIHPGFQMAGDVEEDEDDDDDDEMITTFISGATSGDDGRDGETCGSPLQLPFNTEGISGGGARLARLIAELRTKTDLDLFQVPGAAASMVTTTTSAASSFDAKALESELKHHERRLLEFDKFLNNFNSTPLPVTVNETCQRYHPR